MMNSLSVSCRKKSEIPSLNETFFANDKIPFGTYVLRNQLDQFYYHNTIKNIKQPFATTWQEMYDTGSLYINVSQNLILSKEDKNAMLNYVSAGNSMFISSAYIDED